MNIPQHVKYIPVHSSQHSNHRLDNLSLVAHRPCFEKNSTQLIEYRLRSNHYSCTQYLGKIIFSTLVFVLSSRYHIFIGERIIDVAVYLGTSKRKFLWSVQYLLAGIRKNLLIFIACWAWSTDIHIFLSSKQIEFHYLLFLEMGHDMIETVLLIFLHLSLFIN